MTQEFIEANLATFGLFGANNRIPSIYPMDRAHEGTASHVENLSRNGHFTFGFDNAQGLSRPSPGAQYWTEYGRSTRTSEDLETELLIAVEEIFDIFPTISINARGGYATQLFAHAAQRLGKTYEAVAISFDPGERLDDVTPFGVPVNRINVELDDFAEFAGYFSDRVKCPSASIALEAYTAQFADGCYIYDGDDLRIGNNSFDEREKRVVGPPSWALVDGEKFSSIYRWIDYLAVPAIPSFVRWSPELIAAQLNAPEHVDFLRQGGRYRGPVPPAAQLNFAARLAMARRICGLTSLHMSSGDTFMDRETRLRIFRLSKLMSRKHAQFKSHYRIPLDRLMAHLGCPTGEPYDRNAELYGHVS